MDYSQISDHPPGSSPWQSSPNPTSRSSYSGHIGHSGSSTPVATSSPYTEPRTPTQDESSDGETLVANGGEYTGSEVHTENGSSPDLSTRLQSPGLAEQAYPEHLHQPQYYTQQQRQPSYQQQQSSYQQQPQRSPAQARYQSGGRPQRNQPQHKLKAKITSLERTGRKDPILRFDVHVSLFRPNRRLKILT